MPPVSPTTTVRPSSRTGLAPRSRRRRLARGEPQEPPERQVLARQEDARGHDVDHHLDYPGEEGVPDRDVVPHVKPVEREHAARLPRAHESGGLGKEDHGRHHHHRGERGGDQRHEQDGRQVGETAQAVHEGRDQRRDPTGEAPREPANHPSEDGLRARSVALHERQDDEAEHRGDRQRKRAAAHVGRHLGVDERDTEEAADHEQHVEEPLEHDARERRAHAHSRLAAEKRRPQKLAGAKRQHRGRPEADGGGGEGRIERYLTHGPQQHAPALGPDVYRRQARQRHGQDPERPRAAEHATHPGPVGAAGGEVEAGQGDGDPGDQTERVAQSFLPCPSGRAALSPARRRDESAAGRLAPERPQTRAAGDRAKPEQRARHPLPLAVEPDPEPEHEEEKPERAPRAGRHEAGRRSAAVAWRARSSAVHAERPASTTIATARARRTQLSRKKAPRPRKVANSAQRSTRESISAPRGLATPTRRATPPSRTSSVPATMVSQPPTKSHPAQNAAPASTLTASCAPVSASGWTPAPTSTSSSGVSRPRYQARTRGPTSGAAGPGAAPATEMRATPRSASHTVMAITRVAAAAVPGR